ELTLGIWQRLGIQPVGFWTAEVGASNELHYILQWEDMADRERKWNTFLRDKEWQEGRAASEEDGPLVGRITNSFWIPTRYSPMK
ncbi:MAG TPA: NIPSNAP family protein, partial [Chloroflexota bacterium]|nr:NIPSNAP family protein [Chloroflexota bacterium]